MTTVRFDRLEKLATFVEMGGPPGHEFDMSYWGNQALRERAVCGTAGCMLGLATLLWPSEIKLHAAGVFTLGQGGPWITGCFAGAKLFGIDYEESAELFDYVPYRHHENRADHKFHARRLREFIAQKRRELGIEE